MNYIECLPLQMIKKLMKLDIVESYNDVDAEILSIDCGGDMIDPYEEEYNDGTSHTCQDITALISCNGVIGEYTFNWDCNEQQFTGGMAGDDDEGKQYDFYGCRKQEFDIPCVALDAHYDEWHEEVEDVKLAVPVKAVGIVYPFAEYHRVYFDEPVTTLHEFLTESQIKLKELIAGASDEDKDGMIHEVSDYVIEKVRMVGNGLATVEMGS